MASSSSSKPEVENLLTTHNDLEVVEVLEPNQEDTEVNCSICLHSITDRTVIPKCSHEFCFECLLVWTEQSRRCPLCSQAIGEYLIHSIRSRYDYRKHYLPSLRTSPLPSRPVRTNAVLQTTRHRRRREREWGTRARESRESDEADKLERSIAKRRWIYRHDLYAKHVASNAYTKYRPYPTTAQFAASQDLISRTTTFLRRELQIWEGLDVEFLTTLIISLMKSIDIRSEPAVKLISEFLDMDAPYTPGGRHVNAEHFAHEVYSYVRSPYKDLFVYDTVVQYDIPSHLPQPTDIERPHRWREPSPTRLSSGPSTDERRRSQKRSRSRSSERSTSWSPSGRKYSPTMKTSRQRTPANRQNSQSPRPSYSISKSSGKRRRNADNEHVGRQHNLGDASPAPAREKETPISDIRDGKGKRKADEIEMTTSLTDGVNSECVEANLVSLPVVTDNGNESDRTRNRIVRVPRNRTLQDSVKAHLAVFGEGARRDTAPSLLTRVSNPPYVPPANSREARNMSSDCQQNAGDSDRARHSRKTFPRPLSPCSQDSKQSVANCLSRAEKEQPPTRSKNSHVSVNIINRSPPISIMSSSRSTACQDSVATLTTVEDNTMTIPFYQRMSRSPPIPRNSQNQVDPPNQLHDEQIPHVQPRSCIDAIENFPDQSPLTHSASLNPVGTRARLLARLEIEKRHVVQPGTENNYSPRDTASCSSSRKNHPFDSDAPLKPHERNADVLDLPPDSLVSEESRKRESKLRARAQLRIRLAAEKRLSS